MPSLRIKKVNELLKQEFGRILFEEFSDLNSALITITQVETSPDLRHAKVYISIFPTKEAGKTLSAINRQIYKLQKMLNKKLCMRPVPKLKIVSDLSGERFTKLAELLKENH